MTLDPCSNDPVPGMVPLQMTPGGGEALPEIRSDKISGRSGESPGTPRGEDEAAAETRDPFRPGPSVGREHGDSAGQGLTDPESERFPVSGAQETVR
jgi:hypothetical protein